MSEAENEARKFYREIDQSNFSEEEKAEFRDEVHEVYGVPYQNTEHGEGLSSSRPPSEYETGVGGQSMSQPCGQRSSAASESDAAVIDGGDTRPNPASRVQSWLKKLEAADLNQVQGGRSQTEGTEESEGSHCEVSEEEGRPRDVLVPVACTLPRPESIASDLPPDISPTTATAPHGDVSGNSIDPQGPVKEEFETVQSLSPRRLVAQRGESSREM